MTKRLLILLSVVLAGTMLPLCGAAAEVADSAATDSIRPKRNIIQRVIAYFADANKPKPRKGFDLSFIGGPYYASETKFGVGLMAVGLYYPNKADTTLLPSTVSLYGKATTGKFFQLGVEGQTHFSKSQRLNFDVFFNSSPWKFWGIGYEEDSRDANESLYKYVQGSAWIDYQTRVADNLFVGPAVKIDYVAARDRERPELWHGEPRRVFSLGVGISVAYDGRDYITEPHTGWYARIDQRVNPYWLGNEHGWALTELAVAKYTELWRGSVLATRLHSRLTYGDTPWTGLSTFGGTYVMRGYYEGRYRDKSSADLCVELRQRVWGRHGLVAWGGVGSVFSEPDDIRWKRLLPNYGIGYRWEFKKRVNARLDFGFGRGSSGVVFSVNEAF